MLSKIFISNYALIDRLEVSFNKGMTVITGETGAGKSIILGALGLTLGERVDTSVLSNLNEKCIIESTFNIHKMDLKSFFDVNDLDFDVHTILRREILPSGKSRAFINDTPVSLTVLKDLSIRLIDVHSQHQTLLLNKQGFQLQTLDVIGNNEDLLIKYSKQYQDYIHTRKKLDELREKELELKNELDYMRFQLNELESLNLEEQNEEQIEEELNTLNNAEDIASGLTGLINLLESESGIIDKINSAKQLIGKISNSNATLESIYERINSVEIELKDLQHDAEDSVGKVVYDPILIERLSEQLNTINSLYQKHYCTSIEDLIEARDKLRAKVSFVNSFDDEIMKLNESLAQKETELMQLSNTLSRSRNEAAQLLEKDIEPLLAKLGLVNASLIIELTQKVDFSSQGKDNVIFKFTANKGGVHQPLDKVASGGELSRLMLCLKKILAQYKQLPSIIFDEIDTGVSGDIAGKMGEMMKRIGKTTQVISITHLPQIAGKGDEHLFVYKRIENDKTFTKMKHLSPDERIHALAKMLSGDKITDEAKANAKILLM